MKAAAYEMVIGTEVHIELSTKSKLFCGCSTAFGAEPNTQICPVCTGMPGALPVLNRKVVQYAAAAGLAMNCDIAGFCRFDRKNYFYPDNPQNYQISQLYLPIARNGWIEISGDYGEKKIGIHEMHMEEDAGKLIHEGQGTQIDYNRSGVPLIEVVSEPDLRSGEEVTDFLEELKAIMQYLGVSDCRLQEGSMRVDVNLSVRKKGDSRLGTRTEMKNLNSFRAIRRAIADEFQRQVEILEAGEAVQQETRRWDDSQGRSFSMRSKEDTRDYRYFPDPDLPPVVLSEAWIREIREAQPELRREKIRRYQETYEIPLYDIRILTESRHMARLFEETAALCGQPKKTANWLMGEGLRLLREKEMEPEDLTMSPEHLAALIRLVEQGTVSGTAAKEIFAEVFLNHADPVRYAEEKGLQKVSDRAALQKVAEEVITAHPGPVEEYRKGKEQVLGFLVGQAMKKTGGKADAAVLRTLLLERLQEAGRT